MISVGTLTSVELPRGPYTFPCDNREALENTSHGYGDRLSSFQATSVHALLSNRNGT